MTDTDRIEFLEQWVRHSGSRGFVWDTFTFKTNGPSVREQLDEQMKLGMVEKAKVSATSIAENPQ